MSRRRLLVVAGLLAAVPPRAIGLPRVVVIPFENASRVSVARAQVMPAVELALRAKGWEVVSGEPVEEFLRARRVRYLDSLPAPQMRELGDAFHAEGAVFGAILTYEPQARDPVVSLVARLVSRDGAVVWSDLATLSTSTSGGAFDRGKVRAVDELARRAVRDLVGRLPPTFPAAPSPAPGATFPGAPRVYRSRDYLGQRLRICVLPLQNLTPSRDAPRLLDVALHQALSTRPDTVAVAAADVRAAVRTRKLRAPAVLSLEQLGDLADAVGTPLFLRGTILAYGDPDPGGAAPAIELYLALVDVRSGQLVWSGVHRRTGSDYERVLRFGAIPDEATLASRIVAELLDAFTRRRSTVEPE
jgi:hypothetical protein